MPFPAKAQTPQALCALSRDERGNRLIFFTLPSASILFQIMACLTVRQCADYSIIRLSFIQTDSAELQDSKDAEKA
jgi:hypothetical protein